MITCGFAKLLGTPVFIVPMIEVKPEEVKRVFGATLVEKMGIWAFPAFPPFFEDVVHDLLVIDPQVQFNTAAQSQINTLRAAGPMIRPDFAYATKPFEHQKEGLEFMLRNPRCAIFYDCGLGKTKIVIDMLRHERAKALVLVPVIGIRNWMKEIGIHGGGELNAVAALAGSREKKRQVIASAKNADVLLVSYDSAPHYYADICENFPFEIIIADESHHLRDYRSKRSKCALALAARAWRRVLMSGTPTLGNPMHLYGQLSFLGKYLPADNVMKYRKRYLVFSPRNQHIVVGFKNLDILNKKVHRVATRKTKDNCLDLPARTIVDVPFDLHPEQRKFYNRLVKAAQIDLGNGRMYEAAHAAVTLQKLLQVLSGFFIEPPPPICDSCKNNVAFCVEEHIKPYTNRCALAQQEPPRSIKTFDKNAKLDAFTELLEELLQESRNKVIVWAHFIEELNTVERHLKDQNIPYVRVDGSNSSMATSIADRFNADPALRVYLGQIKTGTSITLNSAAYMIYYGLNYSLDDYLQSIDRNLRIGQSQKTTVYRLIDEDSVLAFVAKALEQKIDLANTLTTRVDCMFCPQSLVCMPASIKPFTTGCKFPSRIQRVITKPTTIKEEHDE